MHHVRSLVDDLIMERRHVSERVGLSYEPLSVIGLFRILKMIHLRVCVCVCICLCVLVPAEACERRSASARHDSGLDQSSAMFRC